MLCSLTTSTSGDGYLSLHIASAETDTETNAEWLRLEVHGEQVHLTTGGKSAAIAKRQALHRLMRELLLQEHLLQARLFTSTAGADAS